MSYQDIDRASWKDFFDAVTKALDGHIVEVDLVAADLDQQSRGDQLNLNGLTYDRVEDALFVSFANGPSVHRSHAIRSPRSVYVDISCGRFAGMVVTDHEGREEFIRLHVPLPLPESTVRSRAG